MWTLKNLERATLALLHKPETRIRVGELDAREHEALSWFQGKGRHRLLMKVDVFQIGFIRGAVHELLHAVLRKEFKQFDSFLEELAVRIWEEALVSYIEDSQARTVKWRRALTNKLGRGK